MDGLFPGPAEMEGGVGQNPKGSIGGPERLPDPLVVQTVGRPNRFENPGMRPDQVVDRSAHRPQPERVGILSRSDAENTSARQSLVAGVVDHGQVAQAGQAADVRAHPDAFLPVLKDHADEVRGKAVFDPPVFEDGRAGALEKHAVVDRGRVQRS